MFSPATNTQQRKSRAKENQRNENYVVSTNQNMSMSHAQVSPTISRRGSHWYTETFCHEQFRTSDTTVDEIWIAVIFLFL